MAWDFQYSSYNWPIVEVVSQESLVGQQLLCVRMCVFLLTDCYSCYAFLAGDKNARALLIDPIHRKCFLLFACLVMCLLPLAKSLINTNTNTNTYVCVLT